MNPRNLGAIGIFLFGTTFLWMTPAMSGKGGQAVTGPRWTAVQVLVWLSIIGFAAAAWAVFKSLDWWAPALAGSAMVGLAATLAYLLAVSGTQDIANVASNVAIHAGVSLLTLVAVTAPSLRDHISSRL
jgi:hypothetical protein